MEKKLRTEENKKWHNDHNTIIKLNINISIK